jgi:hypothetical protein
VVTFSQQAQIGLMHGQIDNRQKVKYGGREIMMPGYTRTWFLTFNSWDPWSIYLNSTFASSSSKKMQVNYRRQGSLIKMCLLTF